MSVWRRLNPTGRSPNASTYGEPDGEEVVAGLFSDTKAIVSRTR